MKLLLSVLAAAVVFCSAGAADGVINIAPGKLKLYRGAALDNVVCTGNTPAVKLVSTSEKQLPKAEITVNLDKNVTYYELSYYVKAENIVSRQADRYGADIILKPAGSGALRFSSRGSYKCDHGTFDWKKVSYKINARRYLAEQPVTVTLRLAYAPGTVWFDQIKLTPLDGKSQSPAAAGGFTFGIYPCCYQKPGEAYEIAENLPAQWLLKCLARPRKAQRGTLTFELELPDFLEFKGLGGFSSRFRNGYFPLQKFTVQPGRKGYKKYVTVCDDLISGITFTDWRKNCMLITALPGSAGKSGVSYWQVKLNGKLISRGADPVKVVPPVRLTSEPCRRFRVGVFGPVSRNSIFRGSAEEKQYFNFWNSLTANKVMLFAGAAHGAAPEYEHIMYTGGLYLESWLGLPEMAAFRKAAPPKSGKSAVPSWYILDDPEGKFEAYQQAFYRYLKKHYPTVKDIYLNIEPYVEQGYDQGGRERFARKLGLAAVPDVKACQTTYRDEWQKYMIDLHRELIAKLAQRIKKENYRLLLCTNKIDSRYGPGVWSAGVDAMDADKYADVNCIMGYSIGSKFFDDVALNVKLQSKPIYPGQDPAEEYRAWYDIYTPAGIRQNVVAAAALGCMGLWYYPSDALSGKYLRAIAEGYSMVSKYEDFYFDGARIDKDFSLTVKNSAARKVKTFSGAETTIYYPDFSGKLRFTAHQLNGQKLLTIFNYTEERLLVEVAGADGKSFLVGVDSWDLAQVLSDAPPEQTALRAEAAGAVRKFGNQLLQEAQHNDAAITWGAGLHGEPVIRLSKGKNSVDLDVFNTLNINSLRCNGGELLQDGFIGKVVFNLPKQLPVRGEVTALKIVNDLPQVTISYTVPGFADEDTAKNVLENLQVKRTFTLEKSALRCRMEFFNPTASAMPSAIRTANLLMPGERFGQTVKRNLQSGELTGGNAIDLIALKAGAASSLMNKLPRQVWTGGKIIISARDGALSECAAVVPVTTGFSGFYSWQSLRGKSMRTVELLLDEKPLAPNEKRCVEYRIEW